MTQNYYGEARALLHAEAPSEELFWKICDLVAASWEHDSQRTEAEFLPFVEQALRPWPTRFRTCPDIWVGHWNTKVHYEAYVPLRLLRCLELTSNIWHVRRIKALGTSTLAPYLTHIRLDTQNYLPARVKALSQTTLLHHVVHLQVQKNHSPRRARHEELSVAHWIDDLTEWETTPHLEHLEIQNVALTQDIISLRKFGARLQALKELRLMQCELHGGAMSELLEGLPHLELLDLGRCNVKGVSVNLRDGRLIIKDANAHELAAIFGSRWIQRVHTIKLDRCHLAGEMLMSCVEKYLSEGPSLVALMIQRGQCSTAFMELLGEHRREQMQEIILKKTKLERDTKDAMYAVDWLESIVLKFK